MSATTQAQRATALRAAWFDPTASPFWFASTPEFDTQLRTQFGAWLDATLAAPETLQPPEDGAERLGLILLCDQLPRNLYRGSANAFALDALARTLCIDGIEAGQDLALGIDERAFFYLPLEHSESLLHQHACVGLLTAMRDQSKGVAREQAGHYLRHAHQHRDIIQRFGRFPHRNSALGRTASPEEAAFAADGSFGQSPGEDDG